MKLSKVKGGFKITLHGLTKRLPKYYFKCYVSGCSSKFHSLKDWNTHHIVQHKTLHSYLKCPRQFKKPSAFWAHQNYIIEYILHRRYLNVKCFASGCKKQYKWRQDLHHHVQKHLKRTYACEICGFITDEKRLLRQHKIKYKDVFNYRCKECEFQCKYYEQLKIHKAKYHNK